MGQMDGSHPRLRLTRTSPPSSNDNSATPVAGPSRLFPLNHHENSEDTQSTPRIPTIHDLSINNPPFITASVPAETPAARLRALLAKVPNSSPPNTHNHRPPAPSSPSETDSDYYPPHLAAKGTPHESLRDLFSRALRDPGDTPERPRRRRNSIDLSEVEASPRLDLVQMERTKSKGKRKSMSDEELEKASKSFQSYSHATTLHTLRQRLANFQSDLDIKNVAPPSDLSFSDAVEESSHDTATILRHLDSANLSPSPATSTPVRSMQFPSGIENEPNLLDQDSEMQRVMKNMDNSVYDESTLPVPFPPSKSSKENSFLRKHGSDDFLRNSNDSSMAPSKFHINGKPPISRLSRHHSVGSSPRADSVAVASSSTNLLSRRSHVFSQHHSDGGKSPRTSSMVSRSDNNESTNDIHDKMKEREKDWNRPKHELTRASSSLSLRSPHDLTRTISNPTTPHSSHALTADRLEAHRRSHSRNSMRADSPASSIASSFDLGNAPQHSLEYRRERNWNSPHPKWNPGDGAVSPSPTRSRLNSMSSSASSRPSSPVESISNKKSQPDLIHEMQHARDRNRSSARLRWSNQRSPHNVPSISPSRSSPSISEPASPHNDHPHHHIRTQSLRNSGTSSPVSRHFPGRNSTSHSTVSEAKTLSSRPKSPAPQPLHSSQSQSQSQSVTTSTHAHSSRSKSPLPSPVSPSISKPPEFISNFGWKLPKSTIPLSPLEPDLEDDLRCVSHVEPASQIPISTKSQKKPDFVQQRTEGGKDDMDDIKPKGYTRSLTELNGAASSMMPRINVENIASPSDIDRNEDLIHGSDEESPVGSTPLARPISLPLTLKTPNRVDAASESMRSQTPTPLLSPPHTAPFLATPPRGSLFSKSRIEFQTPSPPKDMPELPGPPSSPSSDERTPNATPSYNRNISLMKTPRPPGAWSQTPTQFDGSTSPFVRADSIQADAEANDGLATPSTTLSTGNFLPPQTPAPPGAWVGTPGMGSMSRKSILKVRFDITPSETETVSSVDERGKDISIESIQMVHSFNKAVVDASHSKSLDLEPQPFSAVKLNGNGHPHTQSMPSPEEPTTPVLKPTRMPKTPPSIRLVDEYGRERVEVSETGPSLSPLGSKSRKGGIRIVDAMGRHIEETASADEIEEPLTRDKALSRVKETVSNLAREMSDFDSSSTDLDDIQLEKLQATSKSARATRDQIVQTIQTIEDDLRLKYGSLRESMRKSKGDVLPNVQRSQISRYSYINTWMFCGLVFLQIVFILYMYRVSHARARYLFLTEYYDPFYPDMYFHIMNPDAGTRFMDILPTWSVRSIPDTFQRAGLIGVCSEFWHNVTLIIGDWQRQALGGWSTQEWKPAT